MNEVNEVLLETVLFTSKRKKASVVVKKADGDVRVYCKGAPDMLFPVLTGIIGVDGNEMDINEKM